MELVCWLDDIKKDDTALVGGKGANLGELRRAGFPVPDGFVVTADAFAAAVRDETNDGRSFAALAADPDALEAESRALQAGVASVVMPDDLRTAVIDAYSELSRRLGSHDPAVAVRSSATAEDLAGTSFAGMHRTFTNIRGPQSLLDAVSSCWQSVYETRALSYRIAQHIEGRPAIAVVVQAMVPAASSGVAFSADPATGKLRRDRHRRRAGPR